MSKKKLFDIRRRAAYIFTCFADGFKYYIEIKLLLEGGRDGNGIW